MGGTESYEVPFWVLFPGEEEFRPEYYAAAAILLTKVSQLTKRHFAYLIILDANGSIYREKYLHPGAQYYVRDTRENGWVRNFARGVRHSKPDLFQADLSNGIPSSTASADPQLLTKRSVARGNSA